MLVGAVLGPVKTSDGSEVEPAETLLTSASVMFDAVFVPGGKKSVEALKLQGDAVHFLNEAFRHYKPIGLTGDGIELLAATSIKGVHVADASGKVVESFGVVTARGAGNLAAFTAAFVGAMVKHRHWDRDQAVAVPA